MPPSLYIYITIPGAGGDSPAGLDGNNQIRWLLNVGRRRRGHQSTGVLFARPPTPYSTASHAPFSRYSNFLTPKWRGDSAAARVPSPPIRSPASTMDFLATQGASRNANGGIYVNGAAYGREKRIEVGNASTCVAWTNKFLWRPNNNQPLRGGKGGVSRGAGEEERQPLREKKTKRQSIATPGGEVSRGAWEGGRQPVRREETKRQSASVVGGGRGGISRGAVEGGVNTFETR